MASDFRSDSGLSVMMRQGISSWVTGLLALCLRRWISRTSGAHTEIGHCLGISGNLRQIVERKVLIGYSLGFVLVR